MDEIYCTDCGKELNDYEVRVPDPDLFPEAEIVDRCIECNAAAGFADLWDITYGSNHYGETYNTTCDVPPGTNTFDAKRMMNKGGGPWLVYRMKKRKW